jgi:hypothetical protein
MARPATPARIGVVALAVPGLFVSILAMLLTWPNCYGRTCTGGEFDQPPFWFVVYATLTIATIVGVGIGVFGRPKVGAMVVAGATAAIAISLLV